MILLTNAFRKHFAFNKNMKYDCDMASSRLDDQSMLLLSNYYIETDFFKNEWPSSRMFFAQAFSLKKRRTTFQSVR